MNNHQRKLDSPVRPSGFYYSTQNRHAMQPATIMHQRQDSLETLFSTVEQAILRKKQQISYYQAEAVRLREHIHQEQEEVQQLQEQYRYLRDNLHKLNSHE